MIIVILTGIYISDMASRGRRPFNARGGAQNVTGDTGQGVHPSIIKAARKSGQLNISGRSLTTGIL